MRLDGLTLNELTKEINALCSGLRVEKVSSAGRHAVLIELQRGNDLLISSSPNGARAVILSAKSGAKAESTGFVMMLRKHIEGGRLLRAVKKPLENAIELWFQGWDDDEGSRPKLLLLEATGPKSNIFFMDCDNTLIGTLKGMQDDRSFSPGQLFEPLTSYDMPDSLTCTREAFIASSLRRDFEKHGLGFAAAIAGGLYGLSSDHVQDLLKISGFEGSDIEKAAEAAFIALRTRQLTFGKGVWPCCEAQGRKGPRPSLILGEEGIGPSACIEHILGRLEREEQISQKKSVLSRTVSMALGRSVGKLEARKAELAEARIGGRFRVFADAILSSLHELPAILPAKAMLMDYSQELPTRIEVPLDTGKTAPQNAECYYLRYNRGKRTENALLGLIDAAEAEYLYLISVKDAVERADDLMVLDQIRDEMAMAGYLKGIIKKARKGDIKKASQPAQYTLSTGHKALVGRNNIQNDELTFSIANPWDIWLHVKGAPGSHVVIRLDKGEPIPPSALEEASRLAMRSSSLKAQDKADVDYTEIRKVKKVKGGLPGAVIYKDQKTITIKE